MARTGRQTPTVSYVLPYDRTFGLAAAELYGETGQECLEWQKNVLKDMMAVRTDGLWTHTKFGYSVPRRNGKNELIVSREMYALKNGEMVMHTAHRTSTSHAAWERLCSALDKAGVVYHSIRAVGRESVEVPGGGKINFRTRSSKGGLGEGYDLLIIDEAQEYTDEQATALRYIVTQSANPQTIMLGTPPTAVSSGTVFTKYRQTCLKGEEEDAGWEEWSIPEQGDVHDVDLWYEANPSLGHFLTERNIKGEISEDELDFNIQRLGVWIAYNQKSAISPKDWQTLQIDTLPELKGKLFVGIKYGVDGKNVAMSIAVKTVDKRIFVECIHCSEVRRGNAWIIDFLREADAAKIVIDGASGQQLLEAELKDSGVKKKAVLPSVKDVIAASATFEQAIFQGSICHNGQSALTDIVSNCDRRTIGTGGGFGYKSQSDDFEVAILDSVILAHWACSTQKATRQRISY